MYRSESIGHIKLKKCVNGKVIELKSSSCSEIKSVTGESDCGGYSLDKKNLITIFTYTKYITILFNKIVLVKYVENDLDLDVKMNSKFAFAVSAQNNFIVDRIDIKELGIAEFLKYQSFLTGSSGSSGNLNVLNSGSNSDSNRNDSIRSGVNMGKRSIRGKVTNESERLIGNVKEVNKNNITIKTNNNLAEKALIQDNKSNEISSIQNNSINKNKLKYNKLTNKFEEETKQEEVVKIKPPEVKKTEYKKREIKVIGIKTDKSTVQQKIKALTSTTSKNLINTKNTNKEITPKPSKHTEVSPIDRKDDILKIVSYCKAKGNPDYVCNYLIKVIKQNNIGLNKEINIDTYKLQSIIKESCISQMKNELICGQILNKLNPVRFKLLY